MSSSTTGEGVKIGLCGCGRVAQLIHLQNIISNPDASLVAFADPDPNLRSQTQLQAPGAVAFEDYRDLVTLPEVDAVVITLPTSLHANAAVDAFSAEKHVYLEKPIATNLADARLVLSAWQQAGTTGMIGFNYRFSRRYQTLKQQIREGLIGRLVGVRTTFSTSARDLPGWKQKRKSGGGVLLDLAAHHIDLLHFIFEQPVKKVFAHLQSVISEEDTAMLQLELAGGLEVQSFFSMSATKEDLFEVYGTRGKLRIDRYNSPEIEFHLPTESRAPAFRYLAGLGAFTKTPQSMRAALSGIVEESHGIALNQFISTVQQKGSADPDLWDGYHSLIVTDAAERAANRAPVELPETYLSRRILFDG